VFFCRLKKNEKITTKKYKKIKQGLMMDTIMDFIVSCYLDACELILVLIGLRIILGFFEEVQYSEMQL